MVMDVRPGRDEALSRLFDVHYANMVRLGFYLTGSWTVGEDLAQEAFVRLWRRWGRLRDHHAALAGGRITTSITSTSRARAGRLPGEPTGRNARRTRVLEATMQGP